MYLELLLFFLFLLLIKNYIKYKKSNEREIYNTQHFEPHNPREIGYPTCDYNCQKSKYEYCLVDGDC